MNHAEETQAYIEHLHREHSRLNHCLVQIGHDLVSFVQKSCDTGSMHGVTKPWTSFGKNSRGILRRKNPAAVWGRLRAYARS